MYVSPSTAMDVLSYALSDGTFSINQRHLEVWRKAGLLAFQTQPNGRHKYDMDTLWKLGRDYSYARITEFFAGETVCVHALNNARELPCFLDDGTQFATARGYVNDDVDTDHDKLSAMMCGVALSDSNADLLVERGGLVCAALRGYADATMVRRVVGWRSESNGVHKVLLTEPAEPTLAERIGSGVFFDTVDLNGSTDSLRMF